MKSLTGEGKSSVKNQSHGPPSERPNSYQVSLTGIKNYHEKIDEII